MLVQVFQLTDDDRRAPGPCHLQVLLHDLKLLLVDRLADLLVLEDIRNATVHVLMRAVLGWFPAPARLSAGDRRALLAGLTNAKARPTALAFVLRLVVRGRSWLVNIALLRHDDVGEGTFVSNIDIAWWHITVTTCLLLTTTPVIRLSNKTT